MQSETMQVVERGLGWVANDRVVRVCQAHPEPNRRLIPVLAFVFSGQPVLAYP